MSEVVPEHGRRTDSDAPPQNEVVEEVSIPADEAPTPVSADSAAGESPGEVGTAAGEPEDAKKKSSEVESLEDFIRYAYGLKGRKPALKPKVEKSIAGATRLEDPAKEALLALAAEDGGLTVARQLLLVLREVRAYPGLRAALRDFVRAVLLVHPLIAGTAIEAVVKNLDGALAPSEGLRRLLDSAKASLGDERAAKTKDAEFTDLKINAAYCLAVWLAEIKGLGETEISALLQKSIWGPAADSIQDVSARLRSMTEIADIAKTGIACSSFEREALQARELAVAREHELGEVRGKLTDRERELETVRNQLDSLRESLEAARAAHAEELARLRSAAEVEVSHLRDDLEQLRTRVLRRLKADVDFLETGLEALRGPEPKVHVMEDRAQRAADALRAEIRNLQEE